MFQTMTSLGRLQEWEVRVSFLHSYYWLNTNRLIQSLVDIDEDIDPEQQEDDGQFG